MTTYTIDERVRISAGFGIGFVHSPATVTLKIMNPSQAVTTYVFGSDPELRQNLEGRYFADVVLDAAGSWFIRWTSTGPHATNHEETITVEDTVFP